MDAIIFGVMGCFMCCWCSQKVLDNEVVKEGISNWLKYKKYVRKTKKINNEEICVICQEDYSNNHRASTMYCNHTFHKSCLKTWLNERPCCPLCNIDLDLLG